VEPQFSAEAPRGPPSTPEMSSAGPANRKRTDMSLLHTGTTEGSGMEALEKPVVETGVPGARNERRRTPRVPGNGVFFSHPTGTVFRHILQGQTLRELGRRSPVTFPLPEGFRPAVGASRGIPTSGAVPPPDGKAAPLSA